MVRLYMATFPRPGIRSVYLTMSKNNTYQGASSSGSRDRPWSPVAMPLQQLLGDVLPGFLRAISMFSAIASAMMA